MEPLSWWAGAAVWEEWVCGASELVGRCSSMGGVGVWKTVTAESPLCTLTVVTVAAQRTSEQRVQKVTLQITGSLMEEV